MYQLILMTHVLVAIALIALVLIQHGKGAEIGAAFGSGASNTVFGSHGTGGFLFKLTGALAMIFFVTSLTLSYMVATRYHQVEQQAVPQQTSTPADTIPVPVDSDNNNN
ncbi:preprotein translocase subunit SecG [Legionella israelensis]|uniref:Protein-export membrane protein SecG n=1 Tax=Legionella israelensis TaxID=454 RepID=A0A0W0W8S7_9GAMM|nr:preprotein translocase subunit SecG [Legionella israelensis]KTD28752.1 protein-export membrane protein secG (preprotein translocase subunit) [Legionella israelensis]QBS09415.1 preprotein translocase subunit SecG [Legionella israelensis]QDP71737.1 preprotein translocase subunit SecG [Legionella israelensis]SCX88019.1 protein translocase subunit secG [Legionella israelensis DSM 19235]STX60316.1 protein-export membrane protein secG (preprotein translocase subunit) [Legionella israelensis]